MKRIKKEKEFVYSEKVIHRGKILDLLIKKMLTQSQAAKEMGLKSTRQVRNLLEKYKEGNHSLKSLIHTKSGQPWNKVNTVIREKVKEIKRKHPNFTNTLPMLLKES